MDRFFLQQLLAQGENTNVEFKSAEVRPEALAKEIVAFANASGVEDDATIRGVAGEKLRRMVHEYRPK